ncbi:1838_t:CDS:2 [Racocetra fulgida]|uniref:1838_t:CDS:1 n=1 Tax=Racocetra fulgida TaxID=60492 RepID=A0A9N8WS65_9GLOM|nr:1838_t:CDS:2 [Racocetra fulgida]
MTELYRQKYCISDFKAFYFQELNNLHNAYIIYLGLSVLSDTSDIEQED